MSVTTTSGPKPAEGWYSSPARPGFVRYWDGEGWDGNDFPATPDIQRQLRDVAESGLKVNNAGIFGFLTVLVAIGVTVLEPLTLVVDPLLGLLALGFGIVDLVRRKTRKRTPIWPAIVAITAGGLMTIFGTLWLIGTVILFERG